MNRKGQIINDEVLGIIEAVGWILLIILIMGGVYLYFSDNSQDFGAKQNLRLLKDRIEYAQAHGNASVLLSLPENRALVGFNADGKPMELADWKFWSNDYKINNPVIDRPKECESGKSCICSVQLDFTRDLKTATTTGTLGTRVLECIPVESSIVVGTQEVAGISITGFDAHVRPPQVASRFGKTYGLILSSSHSVRDVQLRFDGDQLLVSSSCSVQESNDDPYCRSLAGTCKTVVDAQGKTPKANWCLNQPAGCYKQVTTDEFYTCDLTGQGTCTQRPVTGEKELGTIRHSRPSCS